MSKELTSRQRLERFLAKCDKHFAEKNCQHKFMDVFREENKEVSQS